MTRTRPLVAFALLAGLAGCATKQELAIQKEDALSAAGFTVRPANTPERAAMLARLPPNKVLRRTRGDTVNYVYADPLVCNCLYVGTQENYNTYRRDRLQKRIADERLLTAQTYDDASWDWGPWGGFGPGFGPGWGYGPGW